MAVDPASLRIVFYPDPALSQTAAPIHVVDDLVRAVAQRMLQLMHEAPGVGLAAPQVGLSWRLFVANATGEPDDDTVFVNPVLSDASREIVEHEEGCLSIPNVTAQIRRPRSIVIDARTLDGGAIHRGSDQMAARIWQHETDHLDGRLILDRMDDLDRLANRLALKELEQCQGRE